MSGLLAAGDVVSHLVDTPLVGNFFTAHTVLMILTAGFMILMFRSLAQKVSTDTPRGALSLLEVSMVWIRDEIVYPWLGEKWGRKLLFYFWTLFFFILFSNLLGLMPFPFNLWGKTATGNIAITGGLAAITFILVQAGGMKQHGNAKYWVHIVPGGVPGFLWPLVWLLEFVGLLVKPFALMVRLFANMTAGHAIIAVLLGFFVGIGHFASPVNAGLATVSSLGFALFIMLFETLVALIQAFIFTVLTAIFISLAVAEEH